MQLEELEIISSIFCGPREMVIDDPGIIVDMQSFISGQQSFLNRKLDYRIYVTLTGFKDRMEVFAELPHSYPVLKLPVVTISYPNISTSKHKMLKSLVDVALTDLKTTTEETFVFEFISWLQDDESIGKVLLNATPTETVTKKGKTAKGAGKPQRLWIYSHHIKSKRKRATIIENARDLQLTGFSLTGKPGIICVEGWQEDTQEFLRIIKAMHWQRIQLRWEETGETDCTLDSFRKFSKFEEESNFTVVNGPAGDMTTNNDSDDDADERNNEEDHNNNDQVLLRLNMSTFSTFLEQHQCGHVMNSLFGFK